jgi:hypothetical protein
LWNPITKINNPQKRKISTMAVQTRIQVRRGSLSQWNAASGVLGQGILYQGELGYETDTGRFKIGDGSTAWATLNYGSVRSVTGVSGIIATTDSTGAVTISLNDPTIQVSDITNFASGVNSLIDSAVSTSIVAGSGVDIVYNSGNNTLTVSSPLTAGSGISLSHSGGNYVVSLSDPTVQLADVTDLSSDARTFLLTPSSSNLRTLVSDETGSGVLVFANSPTLVSPNIGVATGTSFNSITGLSSSTPIVNGTAVVGTSTAAARADHVHPTDTSRAATSGTLAQFASTTSSQLAGIISDETGTGSLVFANNPTMSGVTVNGNLTVSGSGLVASNINNFDSQVRTSRLDQMAVPTASVSLNSQKITNLATPTDDNDAVTKAYVDAARSGLDVKQSVRAATTANITLSGTQTIDGVSVIAGDRVLVKDQSTGSQNGIYVVAAGSWSRATDAGTSTEVTAGMFTFVTEGTLNADSGWVLTTNDTITLGTTALAFAQFSGAGQITAGDGLTKSGNTINVGTANTARIVVNADNIDLATVSRSDSGSGNVVVGVTTDSYGRVTGVASGLIPDASTTVKGIASFDTGDFSVTSGAVSIKVSGVGNSQLENSAITIGSSSVSLGGTITAVSGLSSVGSTSFVGALTGNASTATALQTARTINGASFDGTTNITISFVDGGTP